MKLKSRKGSTLLLTLMVFAILMIFVTFISGFMLTENKQAMFHQNKMQAYYIARGGAEAVEAAILGMDEDGVEELEDKLKNGIVDIGQLDIGGNKAYVTVSKDGENILIESVGYAGDTSEKATKVMGKVVVDSQTAEIEYAVFAGGDIEVINGTINGDIGTNGNIKISGWPTINGNAFLLNGKEITATNSEWLKQKWSDDRINRMSSDVKYDLPTIPNYFDTNIIPDFPNYNPPSSIPLSSDLIFDWTFNQFVINTDKRYKKIIMKYDKTLKIDATYQDINIWTESLQDVYQIKVKGNNKVNIHVKNRLSTNSSVSPFIKENLSSEINIYYSGNNFSTNNSNGYINANLYLNPSNKDIVIKNSQVKGNIYIYNGNFATSGGSGNPILEGNIYSKQGDVSIPYRNVIGDIYVYNGNFTRDSGDTITGDIYITNGDVLMGNGKINGNILSAGNIIKINGSGKVESGLIYAPSARVEVSEGGAIEGAVISNTFTMSGGGSIVYKPESFINDNIFQFINADLDGGIKTKYKSGYYK